MHIHDSNASEEYRAECTRLLIEADANVNAKNNEGKTALHEAFLTVVEKTLTDYAAKLNSHPPAF